MTSSLNETQTPIWKRRMNKSLNDYISTVSNGIFWWTLELTVQLNTRILSVTFQSQVPPLTKPNQLFHKQHRCGANHSKLLSTTHKHTHTEEAGKEWEQRIRKTGSVLQEWTWAAEKQMCCPKNKETLRSQESGKCTTNYRGFEQKIQPW